MGGREERQICAGWPLRKKELDFTTCPVLDNRLFLLLGRTILMMNVNGRKSERWYRLPGFIHAAHDAVPSAPKREKGCKVCTLVAPGLACPVPAAASSSRRDDLCDSQLRRDPLEETF